MAKKNPIRAMRCKVVRRMVQCAVCNGVFKPVELDYYDGKHMCKACQVELGDVRSQKSDGDNGEV